MHTHCLLCIYRFLVWYLYFHWFLRLLANVMRANHFVQPVEFNLERCAVWRAHLLTLAQINKAYKQFIYLFILLAKLSNFLWLKNSPSELNWTEIELNSIELKMGMKMELDWVWLGWIWLGLVWFGLVRLGWRLSIDLKQRQYW